MGLLVAGQHRLGIEQTESLGFEQIGFDAVGIADAPAEHLVAAADPGHPPAFGVVLVNGQRQAAAAQELQVGEGALGTGEDQQVEAGNLIRSGDIAQVDVRFMLERIEVGVVGQARQAYHADAQRSPGAPLPFAGQADRIFFGELQVEPRDDARTGSPVRASTVAMPDASSEGRRESG